MVWEQNSSLILMVTNEVRIEHAAPEKTFPNVTFDLETLCLFVAAFRMSLFSSLPIYIYIYPSLSVSPSHPFSISLSLSID